MSFSSAGIFTDVGSYKRLLCLILMLQVKRQASSLLELILRVIGHSHLPSFVLMSFSFGGIFLHF
jgi:hypothetical protein